MNDIEKLLLELVNLGFLDNTPGINRPYKEVDGIYGPKTAKAHKEYLASLNNKDLPKRTPTLMSFQEIKDYENLINLKSNEEIINHYHTSINNGLPYIIDDKLNNKLRVYINGKLIREYDAIHGKYSTTFGNYYNKKIEINNDSYTVKPGDNLSLLAKNAGTTVDVLLKLNNIADPNLIHVGDVIKFPGVSYLRTEVNPDEMTVTYVDDKGHIKNLAGNLTTPAGIYYSTKSARNYNGAPSFYRRTKELVDKNLLAGIPSSIHARNIVEGANTNGCTGLCKKDLYDLSNLLNGYDTTPTYILPADERNKFKIRNGLLSFSSHDLSKTPSQHTIDYSPINKITFSNKDLDENKKKTIRNFSLGLIRNKEALLKDLKINNDTYNLLALYALGILGAETNYGDKHSGISNLLHAVGKYVSKSNSSPDYESKYFTYGAKENYRSIGLTLIRPMYLSYDELKLMTKYKINKKDLVTDPQKAAIATMIKLASEYKKLGMDFDKAIASWNTRSNYVDRVKNNSKRFDIYLKYMKAKTGGILKYLTGNPIVYEYLKAIENPDSVGWDGKVWRAPTIKGFDKNQRAFGLDVVKNEAVRKLTEGRPGRWLTDSEATKLMNDHIDYVNGAATRHIKGFTTFSPKRLAALLGMLYRGDSVNKSGINLLEPNDNKFFKSISDYYRKKGFNERANNSDKFFNVYKKGGLIKKYLGGDDLTYYGEKIPEITVQAPKVNPYVYYDGFGNAATIDSNGRRVLHDARTFNPEGFIPLRSATDYENARLLQHKITDPNHAYQFGNTIRNLALATTVAPMAGPLLNATTAAGDAAYAVYKALPLLTQQLISKGTQTAFAADGLHNFFGPEGTRKTTRLFNEGKYGDAALSAAGDILNLSMAVPALNTVQVLSKESALNLADRVSGIIDLAKYGIKDRILGFKLYNKYLKNNTYSESLENLFKNGDSRNIITDESGMLFMLPATYTRSDMVYTGPYSIRMGFTPNVKGSKLSKNLVSLGKSAIDDLPAGTSISADAHGVSIPSRLSTFKGRKNPTKVLLEGTEDAETTLSRLEKEYGESFIRNPYDMSADAHRFFTLEALKPGRELVYAGRSGKFNSYAVSNPLVHLWLEAYELGNMSARDYVNNYNNWVKLFGGRPGHIDLLGKPYFYHPTIFIAHKKGGKMKRAFVPEVNVLDSNPDIKKKKKLKKAAEGTKMSVGLWLNSDTGLVFTNLGMLLWSGIQNNYFLNKVKKDLEQWKSSYLKSLDDNLPDFTLLATQMEKEGLQDGQNASPISIAKKNWDLLQQYRLKMLALASIAADLLILNLLFNLLKLTNSGWGDILSAGLGIAGSFLSKKNDNSLKQTTTV